MGGPCFLHGCPLSPEKQSLRHLLAKRTLQPVPVTPPGGVGSRCPRRRARCNWHEARAGLSPLCRVVVRVSTGGLGPIGEIVSLLACTQRTRRGVPLASRLDLLAFSGDKCGRSKALFYVVLDGTSISDPERVVRQVIGLRIPRSWLEHLDDESLDLIDSAESSSVKPVSDLDYCQIGMTAIVRGDVNAVYAHRRQLLAARALNERSLLIRGLPFPAHEDDWGRTC